jgi:hypothetical protein
MFGESEASATGLCENAGSFFNRRESVPNLLAQARYQRSAVPVRDRALQFRLSATSGNQRSQLQVVRSGWVVHQGTVEAVQRLPIPVHELAERPGVSVASSQHQLDVAAPVCHPAPSRNSPPDFRRAAGELKCFAGKRFSPATHRRNSAALLVS